MKKPLPLSQTNPYLKDPKKRLELVKRSVNTSSAVEGIKPRNIGQEILEGLKEAIKYIKNTK